MVDKKPIIGIMSLQAVNNYGSYLQAYATQTLFETCGFEVFFFNYIPKFARFWGLIKHWTNWNPIKIIIMLPTIARWSWIFKAYRSRRIHFSDRRYFNNEDLKKYPVKCDALCVGSDQVWNSIWNKGILPEFYLEFADDNVFKFSFASSFGRQNIEANEVNITRQWLKRFNKLSVREKSANDILKKCYGINDTEVILDPTLLITAEEWRRISSKRIIRQKYIVIYNLFRSKEFDDFAVKLSKETGLMLVRICFRYDQILRVGHSVLLPTIPDFLSLIDNAEYVLTDSFHGTAFSINFNKYPICYLPPKFSTRIKEFLHRIDAEDRIVKSSEDFYGINKNLDFVEINKILDYEREKSISFLRKIHEEICSSK